MQLFRMFLFFWRELCGIQWTAGMEKQSDFIQCDYLFEDQTVEIIAKQIDATASISQIWDARFKSC